MKITPPEDRVMGFGAIGALRRVKVKLLGDTGTP